jgi:hypothetical protein
MDEDAEQGRLFELARKSGKAFSMGRPIADDVARVVQAVQWIIVLAVPRLFRGLTRTPPREHLMGLLDTFVAYARRDGRYSPAEFAAVPYEQREALALKLRALVESWTPPALPSEITEAARALLYAEGRKGPPGGWGALTDDMNEEELLWPEGVPALLKLASGSLPEEPSDARG